MAEEEDEEDDVEGKALSMQVNQLNKSGLTALALHMHWQPKHINKVALLRMNYIIGDDDDEDDEAEGGTGKRAAEDDEDEVSLHFETLK